LVENVCGIDVVDRSLGLPKKWPSSKYPVFQWIPPARLTGIRVNEWALKDIAIAELGRDTDDAAWSLLPTGVCVLELRLR
jgi:hypothetical protein